MSKNPENSDFLSIMRRNRFVIFQILVYRTKPKSTISEFLNIVGRWTLLHTGGHASHSVHQVVAESVHSDIMIPLHSNHSEMLQKICPEATVARLKDGEELVSWLDMMCCLVWPVCKYTLCAATPHLFQLLSAYRYWPEKRGIFQHFASKSWCVFVYPLKTNMSRGRLHLGTYPCRKLNTTAATSGFPGANLILFKLLNVFVKMWPLL